MAISVGKKAPDFKLKDKSGKVHSLSTFKGKNVVLYFYPKDDTPGCTIEAQGFNETAAQFKKLGAVVVGVSGGDEKTKTSFCRKYGLTLPLLSDPTYSVAKSYSSYGTKTFMGRKYKGVLRNTFVIDSAGKVVKMFDSVKPETHPAEVLSFLKKPTAQKTAATKTAKRSKRATAKPSSTKKTTVKKATVGKTAAGRTTAAKTMTAKKTSARRSTPTLASKKSVAGSTSRKVAGRRSKKSTSRSARR